MEASPVLQRFRRQSSQPAPEQSVEESSALPAEPRPMHFKGVIQDIQVGNMKI